MIQIGIIMGSNSDWNIMSKAAEILQQFEVPFEAKVVSAHRTPDLMFEYKPVGLIFCPMLYFLLPAYSISLSTRLM